MIKCNLYPCTREPCYYSTVWIWRYSWCTTSCTSSCNGILQQTHSTLWRSFCNLYSHWPALVLQNIICTQLLTVCNTLIIDTQSLGCLWFCSWTMVVNFMEQSLMQGKCKVNVQNNDCVFSCLIHVLPLSMFLAATWTRSAIFCQWRACRKNQWHLAFMARVLQFCRSPCHSESNGGVERVNSAWIQDTNLLQWSIGCQIIMFRYKCVQV